MECKKTRIEKELGINLTEEEFFDMDENLSISKDSSNIQRIIWCFFNNKKNFNITSPFNDASRYLPDRLFILKPEWGLRVNELKVLSKEWDLFITQEYDNKKWITFIKKI